MNTPHLRPKIAVVGAGWAGLSAAVSLARRVDVTVFEAGRQAGGRARTLAGNTDGFSFLLCRSEERRVGKECRSRWSPYH